MGDELATEHQVEPDIVGERGEDRRIGGQVLGRDAEPPESVGRGLGVGCAPAIAERVDRPTGVEPGRDRVGGCLHVALATGEGRGLERPALVELAAGRRGELGQ